MARERRGVRAVAVLASMFALAAIGCADGGDQGPVSSPPSPPDFVQAFSYIEEAHAMIQAGLARGVVSSEEIAVRLHRSFDLIGAMVATNPVEAP